MIHVLRVLRIHQWAKNFLIFLPFILSNKVFTFATFQQLLLGFFCFSLVSSSIYILNDIFDLKYDQKHNIKKYRPIASGKLTPRLGFFISLFLILTSLLLSINFMGGGGGY